MKQYKCKKTYTQYVIYAPSKSFRKDHIYNEHSRTVRAVYMYDDNNRVVCFSHTKFNSYFEKYDEDALDIKIL